jgi:DNA polymerase (family 10)
MRVRKSLVLKKYLDNLANKINIKVEPYKMYAYTKAAEAVKELSNAECDLMLGNDLDVEPSLKVKFIGPKIRAKLFKATLDDDLIKSLEDEVLEDLKKQNPSNPHKHYMSRSEATLKISPILQSLDELEIMHEVVGSFRREKELIGDIDIILKSDMPKREFFESFGQVQAYGSMKVKLVLKDLEVDFRSCNDESYPFMKLHFTGSASFNQWMRSKAKARGFKLNEYGLFVIGTDKRVLAYFKEESDIFDYLGIPYVEPNKRY